MPLIDFLPDPRPMTQAEYRAEELTRYIHHLLLGQAAKANWYRDQGFSQEAAEQRAHRDIVDVREDAEVRVKQFLDDLRRRDARTDPAAEKAMSMQYERLGSHLASSMAHPQLTSRTWDNADEGLFIVSEDDLAICSLSWTAARDAFNRQVMVLLGPDKDVLCYIKNIVEQVDVRYRVALVQPIRKASGYKSARDEAPKLTGPPRPWTPEERLEYERHRQEQELERDKLRKATDGKCDLMRPEALQTIEELGGEALQWGRKIQFADESNSAGVLYVTSYERIAQRLEGADLALYREGDIEALSGMALTLDDYWRIRIRAFWPKEGKVFLTVAGRKDDVTLPEYEKSDPKTEDEPETPLFKRRGFRVILRTLGTEMRERFLRYADAGIRSASWNTLSPFASDECLDGWTMDPDRPATPFTCAGERFEIFYYIASTGLYLVARLPESKEEDE